MNRIGLITALLTMLALGACTSTLQGAHEDAGQIGDYLQEKYDSF